jgi:chromosome segregation ATPase
MSMIWVILTACAIIGVTGYSKFHLNRARAKLADVQNDLAHVQYRLNALLAERKPIEARIHELDLVNKEVKRQIGEVQLEHNRVLEGNREIQEKIDTY